MPHGLLPIAADAAVVLPRIGITCSSGMGQTQAIEKVGRSYVDGVVAAGGLPVVLPSLDPAVAAQVVDGLDGLLLTGGGDVDPARYGAGPEPECGPPDLPRDAWELALIDAARSAARPILGICRGIQVLNVAFGGTLVQDLPARGIDGHDQIEQAGDEVHRVRFALDSLLHQITGTAELGINTLHHQAVDAVGDGLDVVGTTDDGVVEAVEAAADPIIAVQWHPELLLDRSSHQALFDWLVRSARP